MFKQLPAVRRTQKDPRHATSITAPIHLVVFEEVVENYQPYDQRIEDSDVVE